MPPAVVKESVRPTELDLVFTNLVVTLVTTKKSPIKKPITTNAKKKVKVVEDLPLIHVPSVKPKGVVLALPSASATRTKARRRGF